MPQGLDPDEVVELPLDRVAVRVLQYLEKQDRDGVQLHYTTLVNGAAWPNVRGENRDSFLEVLAEAWDWLLVRGLISSAHPSRTTGWGAAFITRRGREFLGDPDGLERLQAERRMEVDLHWRIRDRVRPQFLLGEYELAAFAALREVEIRVRELAGAPESLLGVKLMQEAFKEGGPLYDENLDRGEREAMMALFRGAIGVFKNPPSHRAVDYGNDPVEASEVVLLADLLLRLLDAVHYRLEAPTGEER